MNWMSPLKQWEHGIVQTTSGATRTVSLTKRGRPRKIYEVVEVRKKNWMKIMQELRAAGLTPFQVSRHLGVSHAAAQNWEDGGEPLYSHGAALLALRKREVKK